MTMIARVVRMQYSLRNRFSEWILGAVMFGLGWMFFLPGDSLGSPALMQMTSTMPENAWALVCTVLGGVRLFILALNGAWRKQGHARAVVSVLYMLVWTQISIAFLNFELPSPGDVIFPIFAIAEGFLAFRAAVEAGMNDTSHKNGGN